MKYVLGIDLGTSGTKSIIFNQDGIAIASSYYEYSIICLKNGWAEQNPEDWWTAVKYTANDAVAKSGISVNDISGIGISGQMHGLVMLDKNGKVLRNCILWCDGRTADACKEITEKVGAQKLIDISANPALTGFTAGKVVWVKNNEPEIYSKCAMMLLPKDYIKYRLTGVYATEVSDASGTNLFDVSKRQWSSYILDKLDIDIKLLPPVFESCDIMGKVSQDAAKATGLYSGLPVVGGAADNMAAAVGTGVVEEGKAFTTLGTSGVVFAHSDTVKIDKKGRVHTFCAAVPGAYTTMSCTLAAGLSLKWFRDNFCDVEKETAKLSGLDAYYLMDKEAEKSPIGANRLIFLPFLMGERSPILDEKARAVFMGLSTMHTKSDMIRAILEGVVYSQKSCIDVFNEMGISPENMYVCGGGGSSPFWRQMIADIYNYPVQTTINNEGGALGAAIIASVGVGLYSSIKEACEKIIKVKNTIEPDTDNYKKYMQYYGIYKELYPVLKDEYNKLSKID